MPRHYKKPKGFALETYPLVHNFEYNLGLSADGSSSDFCTYLTFIYTRNGHASRVNPEAIEVNPMHMNYAEETGPLCNYMSIMDRFSGHITLALARGAHDTNKVRALRMYIGFYRMAFEDIHNKTDIATGATVDTILDLLTDTTTDKDSIIDFDTNKLNYGTQPLSTVNDAEGFADYGLTTSVSMENINFVPKTYYDARAFASNGKFVGGILPKLIPIDLTANKPFRKIYLKNIPKECRRGNDYVNFGMFVFVPTGDKPDQYFRGGDVTDITHVHVSAFVRYLEWNPHHDQTEA